MQRGSQPIALHADLVAQAAATNPSVAPGRVFTRAWTRLATPITSVLRKEE
jgi:hypothetical protein